jgi:hypothetical protein
MRESEIVNLACIAPTLNAVGDALTNTGATQRH